MLIIGLFPYPMLPNLDLYSTVNEIDKQVIPCEWQVYVWKNTEVLKSSWVYSYSRIWNNDFSNDIASHFDGMRTPKNEV